ncbi:MAG: hypothetical protein ABSD31_20615 [Candidatus Binataceae bacterium]|jgi:hypothetical protein
MRIAVAIIIALLDCAASVAYAAPPYKITPAGITDASRDATTYGDFIRLLWVDPGIRVDHVGRYDQYVINKRAFVTATTFLEPAVTVDRLAALVGNYWPTKEQDLVLIRCRPSLDQHQALNPILATWPNVFSAIVSDFQGQGYSCDPPNPNDGNNVIYCVAKAYQDSQEGVFVDGLSNAFSSAAQIFQSSPTSVGAVALKVNYGIYPAFTGLGFAAEGSGTVGAMNTATVLRESVVPEYLLGNLALTDAGCRCIQVPRYGNANHPDQRHGKTVDPNDVWQRGTLEDGACRQVNRLPGTADADPAFADESSTSDAPSGDMQP